MFSKPLVLALALFVNVASAQNCDTVVANGSNNPSALSDSNSPASQARAYVCQSLNSGNLLQKFALATFAKSVYGDASFLSDLFPGGDECSSQYISCDTGGAVIGIDVQNKWLTGALPPELALLTSLETFDANRNHFSGVVPAEFASLVNLQRFDVESGDFTGNAFPPGLCGLGSLTDFRADCPQVVCCVRFITSESYCAYKQRLLQRGLLRTDCGPPAPAPSVPSLVSQQCSGSIQESVSTAVAPGTSQRQELKLETSTSSNSGTSCLRGLITVPEYAGPINIGIVIDISKSTYDNYFQGTEAVGDVNNDGRAETILDAEIAAVIKFLESLVATPGFNDNNNVDIGIITFSTQGYYLGRWGPVDPNDNTAVNPSLLSTLRGLRYVYYTNFDDALDKAIDYFDEAPPNRNNVMFFLSDGKPNICGDGDNENQGSSNVRCNTDQYIYNRDQRSGAIKFDSELAALDAHGVVRHSIGVGTASNVDAGSGLDKIDNTPDPVTGQKAIQVTDTDGLVGILLANPVAGTVDSFEITLNGNAVSGIDVSSLNSNFAGFSFGDYVLGGLNTASSNSNTIIASCGMSFNGQQYTISTTTTIGPSRRLRAKS